MTEPRKLGSHSFSAVRPYFQLDTLTNTSLVGAYSMQNVDISRQIISSEPNIVRSKMVDTCAPIEAPSPSLYTAVQCIKARTSQTQSRSSQPQLATQPSLPNKHQSTPVANSVCRPILPISRAPFPCPSPPSLQIRQVMS